MSDELPPMNEAASDSSLILRIEKRDEAAMGEVFERYSRLVYSIALRILRDPEQAEDVLQDVFMQLWRKPISLDRGRGSLSGLLIAITRNRSIDIIRRRRNTQSTDEFDIPSSFNLATDSERRLLVKRVREIAATLPLEQRAALELAFFEGLTHVEIAAKTGVPLGTVKTRIRIALQSLGRTLKT